LQPNIPEMLLAGLLAFSHLFILLCSRSSLEIKDSPGLGKAGGLRNDRADVMIRSPGDQCDPLTSARLVASQLNQLKAKNVT
jgi:hypothetical protein